MTTAELRPARDPGLDFWRAIAVLLVIARHLDVSALAPGLFRSALSPVRHIGWIGVDLFFVLSGYLVSGLLFDEVRRRGSVRIGRFLARRGLKIYPAFYALLLVTCVVRLVSHGTLAKASVASEFFFVQNYGQPLWIHTWSLAVEEHFYLVLSLLFAVAQLRKKAFNPLPWAILAMVLCPIARGLSQETSLYLTHQRIDALFFGVLLRWAFGLSQVRRLLPMGRGATAALALAAIALMAPVAVAGETTLCMRTLGLSSLYLGAGALLAVTVEGQLKPRGLLARGLAKIGLDSYSIYLWHLPVLGWSSKLASRFAGLPASLFLAVQVLLCVLVGIGLARMIERPFLALRDRWLPSHKSEAAVHPEAVAASSGQS